VNARTVLYALLSVVAGAAAVLSFAALRDLALMCGFAPQLAWLLPVVVDAGAAAGSLVWLGGAVPESARRFARALALALLGLSVAANALGHGLAAFRQEPAWWVVVIVSAVAPAVLGAVVHLAVLVGREPSTAAEATAEPDVDDDRAAELIAAGAGRRRISRELGVSEYEARRLIDRARATTPSPDLAHAATNGAPIRSEILP
jgi:hypothetical protein